MVNSSIGNQVKVHHYNTKAGVTIETSRTHRVNLDGEIWERTPLHFRVEASAFRVFAPRPSALEQS